MVCKFKRSVSVFSSSYHVASTCKEHCNERLIDYVTIHIRLQHVSRLISLQITIAASRSTVRHRIRKTAVASLPSDESSQSVSLLCSRDVSHRPRDAGPPGGYVKSAFQGR
jgi:hypothetical protein